jgi:hypothetical protein
MVYLSNAFSLQMQGGFRSVAYPIEISDVPRTFTSVVGHADISRILSSLLDVDVPVNRVSVSLLPCDVLYVGQYCGPRLPEGAVSLPDGAIIRWYRVEIAC